MISTPALPRCSKALAIAISIAFASALPAGAEDDELEREVVDMAPDDRVGWSLRNVAAPLASLFQGGPSYYYKQREIQVDTTPSGGWVDLFYVRKSFQKRFEQAQAPVTVLLPPRIHAGDRDSLTIRAFREGYRQKSITIPAASRRKEVVINLDPLPNTLKAVAHRYFAGRSTLVFMTTESPTFRVQEKKGGFTLILSETARTSEAAASISGVGSPMLKGAKSQQLGEDLVVKVEFREDDEVQLRSKLASKGARNLYAFSLDVLPAAGRGESVADAQEALSKLETNQVIGCNLDFDRKMRSLINKGDLSRALTPRGAFTDPYLRAAMRRLGEISPNDGIVEFGSNTAYRPEVPIELEAALSQAADARGFLVLLRQFVSELEAPDYRRETLRSLIAPELDPMSFGVIMDKAEQAEQECLAAR
jgi:hypothetical protein